MMMMIIQGAQLFSVLRSLFLEEPIFFMNFLYIELDL